MKKISNVSCHAEGVRNRDITVRGDVSEDTMEIPKDMIDRVKKDVSEAVVHPLHYNSGKIEVWDAIEDWGVGFLLGNVIKYCARAGKKGNRLQDLKKAKQYIDKAIEVEIRRSGDER